MTDKDFDLEAFLQRIINPQTPADKELMWTAIGFFVFGALVF